MSASKVKVRGIYATALTELLGSTGHEVVQPSGAIDSRFDASFNADPETVAIETTADRQGVQVTGEPAAVDRVADDLTAVGIDAFSWRDPLSVGTIADGRVTDTVGGGAIVDVGIDETTAPGDGDGRGYLPFDRVDGRIHTGDLVRVRVVEGAAPWTDRRSLLDASLAIETGLVTLVPGREGTTVETRDEAAGRELVGMTELLDVTPPEGWASRWSHEATTASMGELAAALRSAVERAEAVEAELDGTVDGGIDAAGSSPAIRVRDRSTRWVWFGRDSRFELDSIRRSVTTTMPGHHRIKAGADRASAGVDFVEALCAVDDTEAFPFEVVTEQFGPTEGDTVAIGHGKPDGRLIVLGEGRVTERSADGTIAVKRQLTGGGTYDALGVARETGDTALTKFREGRWWYPTVYRSADGEVKGTYVNVCTPVECFPDTVRYVDLHVDVLKHADGWVERVDDDELDAAVRAGQVCESLAEKARSVATALENAL
ncbi:MAG: DUF402 domain-containing protein [Halobacteriota archaeon]